VARDPIGDRALRQIAACSAALSIAFVAATCGSGTAAAARVVSLDGATTEIIAALGAQDDLVGRDDSSYYPAAVRKLPSVGYQFTLDAEGILSLHPTLVIGRDDAKPESAIDQVRAAGVPIALLADRPTTADAEAKIARVAALLHREPQGATLIASMQRDVRSLDARIALRGMKPKARVLVILGFSVQSILACGPDSGPGAAIVLAGAINALPRMHGCKPATPEAVIEANPDVIVDLTGAGSDGIGSLSNVPGIAQTAAARDHREYSFDALYIAGFGPRTGKALLSLFDAIYST
jgi:iron complex transport system substrate-binding protein